MAVFFLRVWESESDKMQNTNFSINSQLHACFSDIHLWLNLLRNYDDLVETILGLEHKETSS